MTGLPSVQPYPRPRRLRLLPFVVVALAAALPAAAIDVFITNPKPQVGVFGEVEIVAEVLSSAAVSRVVFLLDGQEVARRTQPPWSHTVNVGDDNVPHSFEVVARDASGAEARAKVVTRTIAVDLALDLELQQLYVTASRGGQRVLDLDRSAFTVSDDRVPQEIVTFERGDVPLTAVLLVDTSISMRGARLQAALEGANAFVRDMRELDEASLMLFSDRLLYKTPFSRDPATIAAGLGDVEAAGGTALNDFLYSALKRLEAEQGRRVTILLSDGTDIESVLSIEDVLWKARRSQTLVYWIRLREGDAGQVVSRTSGWRDGAGHAKELAGLGQLVEESGGRIVDIERITDATSAFRDILSELRQQYVLGYYPSRNENDNSWHEVKVRVDRLGVSVRTREGYVDF
jgi:Ca-activated chloride channel homolog